MFYLVAVCADSSASKTWVLDEDDGSKDESEQKPATAAMKHVSLAKFV